MRAGGLKASRMSASESKDVYAELTICLERIGDFDAADIVKRVNEARVTTVSDSKDIRVGDAEAMKQDSATGSAFT